MNASVRFDEPLSRHTAYRTGGPCDVWVVAHDVQALATVIEDCETAGWSWTMLGAGTRSLFRDGGYRGVVIRLGTGFSHLSLEGDAFEVGAAVPVCAVAARAADHGSAGLAHLAAVPGTVGASVVRDEWGPVLRSVSVLRRGRVVETAPDELGRRPVVVGVTVERGAATSVERARRETLGALAGGAGWCADPDARHWLGSWAGTRLRQVAVPVEAPELMVNLGGGTCRDFSLLQRTLVERLRRERGVELVPRLSLLGSGGDS